MWYTTIFSLEIPIKLERIYHPKKKNWVARFSIDSLYFKPTVLDDGTLTVPPLHIGDAISIHWIRNDSDINIGYSTSGGKAHAITRDELINNNIINAEVARGRGEIPYEITYIGIIRTEITNDYTSYVTVTGRSINGSNPISKQVQRPANNAVKGLFDWTNMDGESQKIKEEWVKNELAQDIISNKGDHGIGTYKGIGEDRSKFGSANKAKHLGYSVCVSPTSQIIIGDSDNQLDIDSYKTNAINIDSCSIEIPIENVGYNYTNISAIEYTESSTIIWI
jgi:hypothetical protein